MSVIKTLNKIADAKAVELKSEKVELTLTDDVKKLNSKSDKIISKSKQVEDSLDKIINSYNSEYSKLKTLVKEAESLKSPIMKAMTSTSKAAKELGISPNFIEGYKDLDSKGKKVFRIEQLLGFYKEI